MDFLKIFDFLYFFVISGLFILFMSLRVNFTIILCAFTIFLAYYDFTFLMLKDNLAYYEPFITSALYDVFVFLLFLIAILQVVKNKIINVPCFFIIFFIALLAVNGLLHYDLSSVLVGYRSYISILLLSFSLLVCGKKVSLNKYMAFLIIFIFMPNVLFSFYQYINYSKVEDFWFYSAYDNLGLELFYWDFFRDDIIRPFGFFTSTLGIGFLSLAVFMYSIRYKYKFRSLILILSLVAMYLTGVRTILLAGVLFVSLNFLLSKDFPLKKTVLYLSVPVSFFVTIVAIKYFSSDLSALGRIYQWSEVAKFVLYNPIGTGIGIVGPGMTYWPDSQLIAFLYMGGGVSFILYFYCYNLLFKKMIGYHFAVSSSCVLFYLMLFQNIGFGFFWLFIIAIYFNSDNK